jgi:hypothetical protein
MANEVHRVMLAWCRSVALQLILHQADVWEEVNRPLRGGVCRIPSTASTTDHDQGGC